MNEMFKSKDIYNNFYLKSRVIHEVSRGNKVRILDVAGDFTQLVKQLGGRTIPLDEIFSADKFANESIVSFSKGNLEILDSVNHYQPQVFFYNAPFDYLFKGGVEDNKKTINDGNLRSVVHELIEKEKMTYEEFAKKIGFQERDILLLIWKGIVSMDLLNAICKFFKIEKNDNFLRYVRDSGENVRV